MVKLRYHRYATVSSTNDLAIEMARAGAPEGTIVIADQQLKGRGRFGRAWWDNPGQSLLMSIIVTPDKPLSELHQLAFVAAVPVAECLSDKCGLQDVRIKWPNDILVRDRKIAGILVETTSSGNKLAAVVGIGLNIRQREFPEEIANTATSVAIEGKPDMTAARMAEYISRYFFTAYGDYVSKGFEDILQRWQKYMWGAGRQAVVFTEGREVCGEIWGVDTSGALLLRDNQGNIHTVRTVEAIHLNIDRSS